MTGTRLWAAVFVGGVAGALARAGIVEALPVDGRSWPWATFAANAAGTLLLGYAAARLDPRRRVDTVVRALVGTGFCGALTTFSTFQVELIRLVRNGHCGLAVAYLVASLGGGLLLVRLAGRRLR